MSNNVALAVAIVGVVGTLTAAVLTQQLAMRAQRDERREERKEERWRSVFNDRRDSCVALNAEARRFEQALQRAACPRAAIRTVPCLSRLGKHSPPVTLKRR